MAHLTRKTKRLLIRPLVASDYRAWKTTLETQLPARNKWDLRNRPAKDSTVAAFRKLLTNQKKQRKNDQFYSLGAFRRSTGEFIGVVAVMDVIRGLSHSAYLGYFLYNRYWNQGYGKEATLAMLDIGFRDIKLHRIEAGIEPHNRRSIFLARSLGLRREGLKKRAVFLRGKWTDLAIYSATCDEFGIKWRGSVTSLMG